MHLLVALAFVSSLFAFSSSAQSPASPDAADKAYSSQNWPEAERQYSDLTDQQPDNARFWYRLGVSARADKHFDAALAALEKAKALGVGHGLPAPLADYELATTYAGIGDTQRALTILKTSAYAGFMQPARLDNDAEWTSLRADSQFIALAKEVHHNAAPCEDPEFRQFDFWLGDWNVASAADGTPRGSSHISKEMAGCVVWENWTSAGSPYFGKSYNTWNPNLKRWEQYWVDTSAGVMFFHGELKNNIMDYWTDDVPQSTGGTFLRHLQFFNLGPDKVRQFSQGSNDSGKTWHTEYDLIYTRTTKTDQAAAASH
ncbi:tetratricopeptide repeat protein [Occallatibacter savannae]|uniref:tetratricopeptide repeat protein n=1 Tax=Occallatibacter savannae TaxID=1002691 RepID=UPI0013A59495|nr:tetratricopeptide repeat protein [Occallatibacter savannae]